MRRVLGELKEEDEEDELDSDGELFHDESMLSSPVLNRTPI